ncbi:MAG TPA: MFS transporter [Actinomycetota bacterium]|nr:MFS transporter [Actinomycetota bacterium]
MTETRAAAAPPAPQEGRAAAYVGRPLVGVIVLAAISLAMGWQFLTDASRGVPAFDTAFYQWRVEYLLENDPGSMIDLRGATGALAGGYRIAEPVLGAAVRTVGGVAPTVPTILLSVLFRILCAAGMAAFAWKHRRNWLLFYVTLISIPALFFLQRFFGYMDNFMTLALLAGVLVLMDRMPGSWGARIAVTTFLFLAGMSHPTTLVIFLLSMGAVAGYRLLRERSLLAALRAEGLIIVTGTVAVIMVAAFWLGGLWGPTSSFSDAAVPPPETVDFFVNRSIGVLKSLEPFFPVLILFPLMAVGFVALLVKVFRNREYFAEVAVAWTLPVAGMLGFLIGAAYPYFRFFNATLAPLLLAAVALTLLILWPLRIRGVAGRVLAAVAAVAVTFVVGTWWTRGLSAWNTTPTWLTPEIRSTMAAAGAYLDASSEAERVVFVTDAQPGQIVPYGHYKEHANAINAGLRGDQIDQATLFFGRIEDLEAGRPSTSEDQPYNDISAETADEALPLLEESGSVVMVPAVFNEHSTNLDFLDDPSCVESPPGMGPCVGVTEGLTILPDASTASVDEQAVEKAARAASEARSFAVSPPGPLSDLGSTLLATIRLLLLFVLPGFLYYRRMERRSWPEAVALVPLFSIASVTAIGVILVAILRGPFTPTVGWISWALAVALAVFGRLPARQARRRDRLFAAPGRFIDETSEPFRNQHFTYLMGAQWFAQMADGLVAAALAKLITFGGAAGFDPEGASSTREALLIVLLTFLPYTLFSPFVGVLIDRLNRRRLLIGANALRAVVLALILVIGLSRIGDPALYVSFLLILAGTRLLLAIKGAGLPAVLGEENLLQGNSISQAGSAIFQLFGAGVALVASESIDTSVILIAGVLVYALATASAFGTGRLGYTTRSTPFREEVRRLFRDIVDGVREVAGKAAAGLALTSFLVIRSLLTFTVLATAFVSRDLIAAEETTTTVAGAAGALGAVIGFLAANAVRRRVAPVTIVGTALFLGGAGMLAFGGIINLLGVSLMAFAVGVSFFLGKIGVDTMMQEALSDSFRGRGFSLQDIAYNFSWIIPALVLFLFLSRDVARILMVSAGAVFLLFAVLLGLWARAVRRTDPEAADAEG